MPIDYGRGLSCNRNPDTGIRYGILPSNCESLSDYYWESIESEYDPSCGHCGASLSEDWETEGREAYAEQGETDEEVETRREEAESEDMRLCPKCLREIPEGDEYPDEPSRQVIGESEEETGFVDSSGDWWVTDSPYYTFASPCSPCAPGAAYLASPLSEEEGGLKAYCLGPEWYTDGKPPYPVYRVSDGSLVASQETREEREARKAREATEAARLNEEEYRKRSAEGL